MLILIKCYARFCALCNTMCNCDACCCCCLRSRIVMPMTVEEVVNFQNFTENTTLVLMFPYTHFAANIVNLLLKLLLVL
jgi:hypothetical protein